jgi:hypothetical protein
MALSSGIVVEGRCPASPNTYTQRRRMQIGYRITIIMS